MHCVAANGRLVSIATKRNELVQVDLFDMYRRQTRFLGANSLYLDSSESATILRKLTPAFESGALEPSPIHSVVDVLSMPPNKNIGELYDAVIKGARGKVVLTFGPEPDTDHSK